jgi:outer membrane lipoprotein carrier protein
MVTIKKMIALSLVSLIPQLLSLNAAYADGMSNVKAFYQKTKSVRASFHQVVTDRQGRKIQEVDGEMQLKRPNQFRWDYNKPYQQQIVSDGQQVWLYDMDLAQVTVNTLRQSVGSSPAALLAGDANIDKSFRLSNASRKDDLEWVSASPKDKESGFDKILMGFKDNKIQALSLIDSFGHTTNIKFSNVELNPVLDEKSFLFKPPQGVDVVGE